jgi:CysZ protein
MAFAPGLRLHVAIPLLINAVLFAVGITAAGWVMESLLGRLPDWLDWLRYLLWPLFAVTALAIVFFGFSMLANVLGAPFNGLLAEAAERRLRGDRHAEPFALRRMLQEFARGIGSELRKLGYFLARAVPCLALFLIPGLNLLAPWLWLAFAAWMLAVEYLEYPMGNRGLSFPDVRARVRSRPRTALGFGAAVMLMTLIPVVNFVAMPAAVCGATRFWVEDFPAADPPDPRAA